MYKRMQGCFESMARMQSRGAMKVLLVGNHEFAGVPSMKIFASTLRRELARLAIDVELIVPRPVFGRIKRSGVGLGKWLGYCDRFLVFPWDLRAAAAKADVVHVCDHSDAMYASMVANRPILVTCHDMLAVRGARGELEDWRRRYLGRCCSDGYVAGCGTQPG